MGMGKVGFKLCFGTKALRGLAGLMAFAIAVVIMGNGFEARAQQTAPAAAPAASGQSPAPAPGSSKALTSVSPKDLLGTWQGTLHIAQQNRDLRTVLKIVKAQNDEYAATFYSIDQGGQPIPVDKTSFDNGVMKFSIKGIGGSYEGKMSDDGKTITGTWTQGPNPLALVLERTTPDNAWPIPEPVKPMAADAHPGFDVVTIKPSEPGRQGKGIGFQGTHFKTMNTDVNDLIAIAYGMHTKQIVGAPDWFGTDLFDIDGVPDVPGRPNIKQMGDMLKALLADRFQLKTHPETKELQVYAIRVASGAPKMDVTKAGVNDPQGFGFRGLGDLVVHNMTMKEFASWMQSSVTDRPVVDQTGLTDRYDFTLKWTPDDSQFQQFRGAVTPQPPPAGDNSNAPPSLYTAVQEQLGLKIEATKAPDDVIVIDHVERPSPN